tara:strand:- start:2114 stop:2791 length:678 start_codon:yes stop_codon:yes gene_type:complete
MAYIGRGLVQGTYIKLDDLQGSFNGTTSTFNLTSGGQSFKPGSASALLVSLGGVIQEPIESYTVVDDQITFSNPPTSDSNIFLIALGSAVSIGTPADNTIDATKLRDPFGTYTGTGGFTLTGIVSATEFRGSGKYLTELSAGKFISDSIGITTNTPAGINTSTLDDPDLVGLGNSFKGIYVSNGMLIHDNELTGAHYIGTNFRGLMAGPVTIGGTLTVDGNYVVV